MLLSSQNLDTKTIGEKYILLKKKLIGSGAFAQVFEGFVKGNAQEKVAIKVLQSLPMNSTNKIIESLKIIYKREREIHSTINSENVVKMIDVIQCDQSTYLILEFCEEGNLNKLLNRQPKRQMNQERAYQIFCQIVEGYKSLYNLKTLHRDLKPENILFSKGVAKIADFGFAKIIEEMDFAVDQTVVGTLLYQAPEMMVSSKYSSKVDIWSLGVIFYEMLYGAVPFMENHPNKLHKKITTEPLKFPQEVQINQSYINLLTKMLKVDPEMRIRWDELFLFLSKDTAFQVITNDNLSLASTHMSDSDKFQTNYKKVEQQINKIDEIKEYFDYVQSIFSFSNNNITRLFFTLQQQLQISQSFQLLFSVTSTKYLLNEYNFYIQILLGQLPPSEINFKDDDIKKFQSDQAKYYSVLNNFKTNHEQMNTFYNDNLLPQYMKQKQADKTNQLIPIVDELVQNNQRNKKSQDSFNKVYMFIIAEITKCVKKKQITDEVTLRNIFTLQIRMFFSLHPQKFIQNEFEPKHLEIELNHSSTQKLENKVVELNIMYSALVK